MKRQIRAKLSKLGVLISIFNYFPASTNQQCSMQFILLGMWLKRAICIKKKLCLKDAWRNLSTLPSHSIKQTCQWRLYGLLQIFAGSKEVNIKKMTLLLSYQCLQRLWKLPKIRNPLLIFVGLSLISLNASQRCIRLLLIAVFHHIWLHF